MPDRGVSVLSRGRGGRPNEASASAAKPATAAYLNPVDTGAVRRLPSGAGPRPSLDTAGRRRSCRTRGPHSWHVDPPPVDQLRSCDGGNSAEPVPASAGPS